MNLGWRREMMVPLVLSIVSNNWFEVGWSFFVQGPSSQIVVQGGSKVLRGKWEPSREEPQR